MLNHSCGNEFYLHENEKSFPYQRLSTYPCFDTEARGELRNSLLIPEYLTINCCDEVKQNIVILSVARIIDLQGQLIFKNF